MIRYLLLPGALSAAILAAAAAASPLVYEPVNPQFGGNPFNSGHLLGVANAQNKYKEKERQQRQDDGEMFARQLQSRLMSALASQVTDAIFGENPQERGTYTIGDQTVSFVRGLDSVELTITNNLTGAVTKITVPAFLQVR